MNRTFLAMLTVVATGLLFASAAGAADCGGGWRVLPNYNPSSGGPCAALGLDTHRGVCLPGQRYETLCDDASGGRYRTCQGSRQCYDDRGGRGGRDRDDDYYPGGGGGGGGYNDGCRGWDYNYNQPCPRGYINRDCRGGCEPH